MTTPKHHFIINIVVYQVCWSTCVLGAAYDMAWLGVVLVAAAVCYHLNVAIRPKAELSLIVCTVVIGSLWDSFLVMTGWLIYANGLFIDGVAPYWIISLWIVFATTLNVSLTWFKQRLWFAALFGAIGGPLAYMAGARLGAVQFSDPTSALSALAVGWTLIMPLMMLLSRHLNGFEKNKVNTALAITPAESSTTSASEAG